MAHFKEFQILVAIVNLLLLSFLISACSQKQEKHETETITFVKKNINVDTVINRSLTKIKFSFFNASDTAQLIDTITTECLCTDVLWKHEPISPRDTSDIYISIRPTIEGPFMQKALVYFSGKELPIVLSVRGQVKSY